MILPAVLLLAQSDADFSKQLRIRCQQVTSAKVYSDAFYSEEGGDVVGSELGILPNGDVLLYAYEGTPWSEPAVLKKAGGDQKNAIWTGNQKLKTVHYPAERTVEVVTPVRLEGSVIQNRFVGTVKWGDAAPTRVRLKVVPHLWGCKK